MKTFLKVKDVNGDIYYINPIRLTAIEPLNIPEDPYYNGTCMIREGSWIRSLDRESTTLLMKYLEEESTNYKECE